MGVPSYAPRFGFRLTPFGKGSPWVETPNTRELSLSMRYLLETKGVGLVSGPPGVGKTTAVREELARLSPMRYRPVYACLTTVTPIGFLSHLSDRLGLPREYTKPAIFRSIQQHLAQLHDTKGIVPVVVIDEASHLSGPVLSDLKMLMNFDMDSANKAVFVLVGLDRMRTALESPQHEALRQRVSAVASLQPLSQEEMRAYIRAKAEAAGGSEAFLAEGAMQAVVNAARGFPRVADQVLGRACMLADAAKKPAVDLEAVKDAVELG